MATQNDPHRLSRIALTKRYLQVLRLCGCSVNEIAENLGVTRNSVTLLASGRQCPKATTFRRLKSLSLRTQKKTEKAIKKLIGEASE